jgi:hypothetical protein
MRVVTSVLEVTKPQGTFFLDGPQDSSNSVIQLSCSFRRASWTFMPVILVHGGTAAFMLAIVELLRSGK